MTPKVHQKYDWGAFASPWPRLKYDSGGGWEVSGCGGAAGRNGLRALALRSWRGFVIPTTVGEGRGAESCNFRWEVLEIDDFMYDFRWEVLKFTISTSHFMTCFEGSLKKMFIL